MRTAVRAVTAAVMLTAVAAVGIWTVGAVSSPDGVAAGDGVAETGTGDHGAVSSRGVVRSWDLERMQGVIDGDEVPGGCHVDFAAAAVDGFPALTPGRAVEFEWTPLENRSPGVEFEFECVRAWPAGEQPIRRPAGFGARAWSVHPDGRIEEEHFTDVPVPVPSRVTGQTVGTVPGVERRTGLGSDRFRPDPRRMLGALQHHRRRGISYRSRRSHRGPRLGTGHRSGRLPLSGHPDRATWLKPGPDDRHEIPNMGG